MHIKIPLFFLKSILEQTPFSSTVWIGEELLRRKGEEDHLSAGFKPHTKHLKAPPVLKAPLRAKEDRQQSRGHFANAQNRQLHYSERLSTDSFSDGSQLTDSLEVLKQCLQRYAV